MSFSAATLVPKQAAIVLLGLVVGVAVIRRPILRAVGWYCRR
jgi:hypothetical protein